MSSSRHPAVGRSVESRADPPHPRSPRGTSRRPEPELEPVATIADQFFDSYLRWREACEDLRTAYDRWHDCAPPQRFLAFDGYRAALDREERAAHTHSHLAEQLSAVAS